jgi:hypothetical protein
MMRGTPEEFERQPYLGMTRNERNAEVRTWGDWEPVFGYFLPEQSTEPHEAGAVRVITPVFASIANQPLVLPDLML